MSLFHNVISESIGCNALCPLSNFTAWKVALQSLLFNDYIRIVPIKSGLNLLDDVQMFKTHFHSSRGKLFKSNGFISICTFYI